MQRHHQTLTGLAALALVAGCAFTPPEQAPIAAQPKTLPTRTLTSFSASLRCMDDLFLRFGKTNYLVTAQEIPDATGQVQTGTKEMLISAISQMSVKSNAFNFVDFEDYGSVFVLGSFLADPGGPPVPAGFEVPNYYIRGAITQLDSGVIAESVGGGLGIEQADIGASTDQVMSVVSVDLNVGNVLNRRMLPGVTANNSIVVRRSGQAIDAGATISELGANFNLSFNQSEGMHSAVRSLMELSTIEILGKLLQVPYWRCLEIEQTNPEVVAIARSWFDSMPADERVKFVQRALKGQGRYNGPISGQIDPATRDAIGAYQAERGLIADGRVNFDLYGDLIASDLALGREPAPTTAPDPFIPASTPVAQPISLSLTTPRGPAHRYGVGQAIDLTLRSTSDAFAYCYYQDGKGTVARIFPNRFAPDPYLPARQPLYMPGGAPFSLVPETPGAVEEVLCVGAGSELGRDLPAILQAQDLTPLPVRDLDQVDQLLRASARGGLATSRVKITVTN
jgi:peptidoglycan hydrolase-like protein with peptidoglycan-binding domain/curli biogenesis system outer membrane secretion channel CsgG